MIKYKSKQKTAGLVNCDEMEIGQTGITEGGLYPNTPVMRIYNINSDTESLFISLVDGNTTWATPGFEVRLCDFELKEI